MQTQDRPRSCRWAIEIVRCQQQPKTQSKSAHLQPFSGWKCPRTVHNIDTGTHIKREMHDKAIGKENQTRITKNAPLSEQKNPAYCTEICSTTWVWWLPISRTWADVRFLNMESWTQITREHRLTCVVWSKNQLGRRNLIDKHDVQKLVQTVKHSSQRWTHRNHDQNDCSTYGPHLFQLSSLGTTCMAMM